MNPQLHSKPDSEAFSDDTKKQPGEQLHEPREPVNFPSSAEVFQAVFENSLHASFIGNCRDKTLEANERVCKMFGYSVKEMIQLSAKDIFDITENSFAGYLAERESNGKATAHVTGIRKNGERFLCKISSLVFIDDDGETRTINTIHDISNEAGDTGSLANIAV